jgi:hypothetical protein
MAKYRIKGVIYEAASPEEARKQYAQDTSSSTFGGALESFNQGLSLGGADELSAGLEAATGGDYSRSLQLQQQRREKFAEENPWIAGGSTALGSTLPVAASLLLAPQTGGLSTALTGGRALQLTRAALGGGGRSVRTGMEAVKEGARVGVPLGSVSGALSAPEDQRGYGAVQGATLGGIFGGAAGYGALRLPNAVEAVRGATSRVRGRFAPPAAPQANAPVPPTAPPAAPQRSGGATAAEIKVLRAMEASGVTPEEAMARLIESRRLGVPLGVIDVGGTQTQRLGRSVRTLPGEGSNIVETALAERAASQPSRVVNALERALGTRATGRGEAVLDDLLTQSRTESGPYYRQLDSLPVITDPVVLSSFRQPAVQGIIRESETAAQNWGRPFNPLFDDNGNFARRPNFTDVNRVNRNINEMLRPSYSINPRPVQSAPVATNEARQFAGEARRELVAAADAAPGGDVFARARTSYAGPAEARDFYEAGLNFPKQGAPDVNAILRNATGPQSKWYRRGQIEALRSGINSMSDLSSQPNVLRSFYGNPESRAKFQSSIPNIRNRPADLEARLNMENEAARTSNFVRSGSQTADKAAEAADTLTPDKVIEAASSPVLSTIKGVWNSISGSVGKQTRAQVAQHLTSFDNPDQSLAFLRRLQELQARGRLNAQTIDAAAAATTTTNQVRD